MDRQLTWPRPPAGRVRSWCVSAAAWLAVLGAPAAPGWTQSGSSTSGQPSGSQAPVLSQPLRITEPDVVVTAQKEPLELKELPVSVTTVSSRDISFAGIAIVSDAAVYAPNTYFTEFTARKLSFPRFRGIGTSPSNPGVTTYVDGVPQLHTNASSLELLDVEQVEFVRGPQSALFGRNALGGLINVQSLRPSLSQWTGTLAAPVGNAGTREVRASASGPLADSLAVGLAIGRSARDGFATNDVTGHDVDFRAATFGKAQLLWTPNARWEARAIVSGERARDGDYALSDLGGLRRNPFHVARDYEGATQRDVVSTTIQTRREGARVSLSTTTGVVHWRTQDGTDLDYTPLPLITRDNAEKATQFSQEVRASSASRAPVTLGDRATLRWQTGLFFFTQGYEQDAANHFAPFVLSPFLALPVTQHSPRSTLDDVGVGVYGQGTVTLRGRVEATAGARFDHEQKDATLDTFFTPAVDRPLHVDAERGFSKVSPQAAVTYRFDSDRMIYGSVSRGFKAGGFNPASPAGAEAYGEELTWNVEGGTKGTWAGGLVTTNASVFYIDWNDLQLNLPNPQVPAQFYIANVGDATSTGAELELGFHPDAALDVFGAFGYTRARFGEGSVSSGVAVSGNRLPNTPVYTLTIGAQYSRALVPAVTISARAEAIVYGAFQYDDLNTAQQDAYALTNLRVGVRSKHLFADLWIRNAFDTRYIPIAFAYGELAPSGFVGEMGRPRTFGVSAGLSF
jgi:iron complex outermembrane receptor protein